jgi:hypothetical protein
MESALTAVVGVALVTAVCLWLLFRRGSMAHRAERDYGTDVGIGTDDGVTRTDPDAAEDR